jgi:hypothetical protein
MAETKDGGPNKMQPLLDHLEGKSVIVKTWFADPENRGQARVYTSLPNEEQLAAWSEAAFTNGGPLVKIELIWDPKEAAALAARTAPAKSGQEGGK